MRCRFRAAVPDRPNATQLICRPRRCNRQTAPPVGTGPGRPRPGSTAPRQPRRQVQHDLERIKAGLWQAVRGPAAGCGHPTSRNWARPFKPATVCSAAIRSQALSWLQGAARVRPAASRAWTQPCPLRRLWPAQLPWNCASRSFPSKPASAGSGSPLSPGNGLSARETVPGGPFAPALSNRVLRWLVWCIDEWVEVIPAEQVTSGVSFQYDAPGARPPQAVLLAVTPPEPTDWELSRPWNKPSWRPSTWPNCARSTRKRSARTLITSACSRRSTSARTCPAIPCRPIFRARSR